MALPRTPTVEADATRRRPSRGASADEHGAAIVARGGRVLFADATTVALLGRSAAELRGAALGFPFAPRSELRTGGGRILDVRASEATLDGRSVWLVSLVDVTSSRRREARLEALLGRTRGRNTRLASLARRDPLTELLNRRGLADELAVENRRRCRSGSPLSAILLDCDDFKRINERCGHAGGDAGLREISRRMRAAVRPSDSVGRFGGDEFLVLLPDTRLAEACEVAERLRSAVADGILASVGERVTVSLGVEPVGEDMPSIDALIAAAERALQLSKDGGKNRASALGAAGDRSRVEGLASRLRARSGFRVELFPIARLADGRVVDAELAVRGPAGGLEEPRDALSLPLERELLTRIDLECLSFCVDHAARLPSGARCHVDVLPSTLLATPPERLVASLRAREPARSFCLELSEQQFVGEPSALVAAVRALESAGVRVAIDDVGSGRSSLETLIVLEPYAVKLDARFVRASATDAGRERALRRVARAVGTLGSRLFADGVDTPGDLARLRPLGVSHGQGALWRAPDALAADSG